jgi:hypothetical protein
MPVSGRRVRRAAIAALCLSVAPIAATAGEVQALVGTYAAKVSCSGFFVGAPIKLKASLTMRVIDVVPGRKELDFVDDGGTRQFTTLPFLVFTEPLEKPNRAVANGASCDISFGEGDGAVIASTIKTKVGKEDVDFAGTITNLLGADGYDVCTFKAKRISSETTLTDGCAG